MIKQRFNGPLWPFLMLFLATPGMPADIVNAPAVASHAQDNRANLPAGQTPWWPSRYGSQDQLGTLNEITPEVVRAAAALVRTGTVVDLGRILDEDTPKFPGRYWHQTVDVSPHFTNLRRPDTGGSGWGKTRSIGLPRFKPAPFK